MFGFRARKELAKLRQALEEASVRIAELERQNNSIRAIPENMLEGVITVSKQMRITSVNSSVERIFAVSKKDTEGNLFLEAIRNNALAEIITAVLEKGKSISRELVLVWPIAGAFQVSAAPIFSQGDVSGCVLVIHDITEVRRLERMRSDFVANVSHELKTPVTAIKGFIETLLDGAMEDKEKGREFLEIVRNHTERLNSLINDLLDLSYLESKEAALKKNKFNLKAMFKEVISAFQSGLKNKQINLDNQIPGGLEIAGDRERLEQVALNLIDNAIKFNRQNGLVRIYCQDLKNELKIFVEDSGLGIPPKDIPRIFERFYRADKARSRELGGTGLGLSIVKHIVELHGGAVAVESTEGLGSKFWFTLPR